MSDLGYIDVYQKRMQTRHGQGFRYSSNSLTAEQKQKEVKAYHYGQQTNWRDPNSTDIHALQKTKNAAAYVCKYVSKDAQGRKVEGRIWGCTDTLKGLKQPEIGVENEFIRLMSELADIGEIRKISYEHCTVYSGNIHEILQSYAPELVTAIEQYYSDIRQNICNPNSN